MSAQESLLVTREVKSMLKKGAIQNPSVKKGQFLSNLFLLGKTYEGNKPVINLKILKACIPCLHFKMEGLHLLNDMLKEKDYMCKRPEGCSLLCSTASKISEVHPVLLEGQSYKFLCLCFGVGPAPRLFTNLVKTPLAILRRIDIWIIVNLDDMLFMSQTIEGLNMARDTLIFLLIHWGS